MNEMHKNECDMEWWTEVHPEENVEKLCQEGHEGYRGIKEEIGTGPLCLEKYYWGSDPC